MYDFIKSYKIDDIVCYFNTLFPTHDFSSTHFTMHGSNAHAQWIVHLILAEGCGLQDNAMARQLGLRNDQNLARYVIEGRSTGNQLGTGSYGSVEEV